MQAFVQTLLVNDSFCRRRMSSAITYWACVNLLLSTRMSVTHDKCLASAVQSLLLPRAALGRRVSVLASTYPKTLCLSKY